MILLVGMATSVRFVDALPDFAPPRPAAPSMLIRPDHSPVEASVLTILDLNSEFAKLKMLRGRAGS
jgi:hypothetical protein